MVVYDVFTLGTTVPYDLSETCVPGTALHYGKRGSPLPLDSTDYTDAVTQAVETCNKMDPLNTHVSVWNDVRFCCYNPSSQSLTISYRRKNPTGT